MGGNKWSSVGRTRRRRSRGPTVPLSPPRRPSVRLSSQLKLTAEEARSSLAPICQLQRQEDADRRDVDFSARGRAGGAKSHDSCFGARPTYVPPSLVPPSPLPYPPSLTVHPVPAQRKVLRTDLHELRTPPPPYPSCSAEGKGERQSELGPMIWAEIVTRSDMRSVTEH